MRLLMAEIFIRAAQAFLQSDARLPAKRTACTTVCQQRLVDIAGACRLIRRANRSACHFAQDLYELIETCLALRREVIRVVDMLSRKRGMDSRRTSPA